MEKASVGRDCRHAPMGSGFLKLAWSLSLLETTYNSTGVERSQASLACCKRLRYLRCAAVIADAACISKRAVVMGQRPLTIQ